MHDSVAPDEMTEEGVGDWSMQELRGSRSFDFIPSSMGCNGGILSGGA